MSFTTGSTAATNSTNDLLDKLKTYLVTTLGTWTQLSYTAGGSDTAVATLKVRGPGAGADRETFLNFRTANGGGNYGIEIRAATDYDASADWGAQREESPGVFLNLINAITGGIEYWFYVNDRRVIIVARVSTSYMSAYCGFGLPFATPEEYPFPLYVGAGFDQLAAYNDGNTRNRSMCDPGYGAAYYKMRGISTWRPVTNHGDPNSTGSGETDPQRPTDTAVMWPFGIPNSYGGVNDDWQTANRGFARLRQSAQSEAPMWNCHIIDPFALQMPMALDGVFGAVGEGRTAESTATNGGSTYRFFQNIGRSGTRNIFAIEEA